MKIKSVQICGMHNVESKTYDFNDMVYLFGKNGAGKSTVMQAIQLALLGYIPGTDKTKTAIFRHANADLMSVSVTFDTGQTVTRMFERSGNTIKSSTIPDNFDPESIMGDLELPVFNFNEFAAMTANKLKDWFINYLPDEDTSVDWSDILKCKQLKLPDDQDMLDSALFLLNSQEGSSLDKVRQFNEYCKNQISNHKFEITRLESTLKSLVFYDDYDSGLDLETVQESIRVAELKLDTAKHNQSVYYINQRDREAIEAIRQETGFADDTTMQARLDELDASLNDLIHTEEILMAGIRSAEQDFAELKGSYDANKSVIDSNGICPFTHKDCEGIKTYISELTQQNAEIYDRQNELRNIISMKRVTLNDVNTQKSNIFKERDTLSSKLMSYRALGKAADSAGDIQEIEQEIEALTQEVKALRENEHKLVANAKYEELKTKVSSDLFHAQHSLEVFKAWEKLTGVNALQTQIMVAPFQKFSEKISAYLRQFLSADVSAEFFIGEKLNSFSFGINNGKYIEYDLLSSGEKCIYALSLLLAIVENSSAQLKLILVDDILDHLDPDRIKDCFATLYNSTTQTVIAGVQKCEHEQADSFVINI